MDYLEKIKEEKGLTLIEVLSSIVILSIILLSFFTLFTNSFRFNSISSDNIEATNIARETQEKFKVDDNVKADFEKLITNAKTNTAPAIIPKTTYPNLNLSKDIELDPSGILHLTLNNPSYKVLVLVDTHPETGATTPIYKIHVQVLNNTKVISETFTYWNN
jgi:prepilin-type N-terminal cleavage/methylation domain-containing protein